jgi:Trk K+ transport system NAD-binding subunit
VLRSGSTNSLAELRRVGLQRAASVISVARTHETDQARETDIGTIKTLMLLSGVDDWSEAAPQMVAEISQKRNVDVARIAGARSIPLVSSSEIISKVIVQSARQPGISSVYSEIFSHGGNRTYTFACPEAINRRFGDVAHWFPDAVLIGIAWNNDAGKPVAALNPEPDYEIAEDELLVLAGSTTTPRYDQGREHGAFEFSGDANKKTDRMERLLILGWNENIDEILGELDAHSGRDTVVDVIAGHEKSRALAYLEASGAVDFPNISVDYREGNPTSRALLESLDLESFDCVITLADDSHGTDEPDARTIMTLLLLGDVGRS